MRSLLPTRLGTRLVTRRSVTAVAAAAAVLTAVVALPGAAQAATTLSHVYISPNSSAKTLFLDVSGGSTAWGAPVIQNACWPPIVSGSTVVPWPTIFWNASGSAEPTNSVSDARSP